MKKIILLLAIISVMILSAAMVSAGDEECYDNYCVCPADGFSGTTQAECEGANGYEEKITVNEDGYCDYEDGDDDEEDGICQAGTCNELPPPGDPECTSGSCCDILNGMYRSTGHDNPGKCLECPGDHNEPINQSNTEDRWGDCPPPGGDICHNTTTLRDYTGYCDGSGDCDYNLVDCDNGCEDGACKGSVCTPDCAGKECGDDGCEGSCGTCTGTNEVCDASGKCVFDPACECGPVANTCCDGCDAINTDSVCSTSNYNSCYDGNVWRYTSTRTCSGGSCSGSTTSTRDSIVEDCGSDGYGTKYCDDGKVVHDYYEKRCSGSSCQSVKTRTDVVETCGEAVAGQICQSGNCVCPGAKPHIVSRELKEIGVKEYKGLYEEYEEVRFFEAKRGTEKSPICTRSKQCYKDVKNFLEEKKYVEQTSGSFQNLETRYGEVLSSCITDDRKESYPEYCSVDIFTNDYYEEVCLEHVTMCENYLENNDLNLLPVVVGGRLYSYGEITPFYADSLSQSSDLVNAGPRFVFDHHHNDLRSIGSDYYEYTSDKACSASPDNCVYKRIVYEPNQQIGDTNDDGLIEVCRK